MWQAAKELSQHRIALISTLCQCVTSGCFLATISSQQGIFDQTFHRAATFLLWFGFIALCASGGSLLNARVVVRLGINAIVANAEARFAMVKPKGGEIIGIPSARLRAAMAKYGRLTP